MKTDTLDSNDHNLPPSTVAKPLPVRRGNADSKKTSKKTKKAKGIKSNQTDYHDDTPREFARMMARFTQNSATPASHTTSRSGSNNAEQPRNRKRKRGNPTEETKDTKQDAFDGPKIMPGERMSDFGARVDQMLPLSGVSKKAGDSTTMKGKDAAGRKIREDRQTKHERKLQRLQVGWRTEEARIREKEAEELEEREEADEEINDLWKVWEQEAGGSVRNKKNKGKISTSKRKKKRGNAVDEEAGSESEDEDDDPWAKLNRKARSAQPLNPSDVVQAPPEKLVKPKEKFKVQGMSGAKVDVADVPAAAGSLRRREELASERKNIVEQYRKLMAGRRV